MRQLIVVGIPISWVLSDIETVFSAFYSFLFSWQPVLLHLAEFLDGVVLNEREGGICSGKQEEGVEGG